MPRNRTLVRLLHEVEALQASRQGLTLAELAALSGVTTRTVRRDLDAMQEAAIPIVDEKDEGSSRRRWRVFDWRKEAA
jgi:predicted DNA-binding transcriptional regulator YafY